MDVHPPPFIWYFIGDLTHPKITKIPWNVVHPAAGGSSTSRWTCWSDAWENGWWFCSTQIGRWCKMVKGGEQNQWLVKYPSALSNKLYTMCIYVFLCFHRVPTIVLLCHSEAAAKLLLEIFSKSHRHETWVWLHGKILSLAFKYHKEVPNSWLSWSLSPCNCSLVFMYIL